MSKIIYRDTRGIYGKIDQGRFAMVLAGAVTFSVTNTLLVDESSKGVLKENDVAITEEPKIGCNESTRKSSERSKINIDGEDVQVKPSQNIVALQEAEKSRNEMVASNHQNTEKVIKTTTTQSVNKNVTTTKTPAETASKGSTKATTSTTVGTNTTRATKKESTLPTQVETSTPTSTKTTTPSTGTSTPTPKKTATSTTTGTNTPTPKKTATSDDNRNKYTNAKENSYINDDRIEHNKRKSSECSY